MNHCCRLGSLSRRTGDILGLGDGDLDQLNRLAVMHDVGKLMIPRKILSKRGPLSREEWAIMEKHPEIGYHIAEAFPALNDISEAILSHHEWYDGSGYPRGLQGKEIPLISRIVAVVDAYDAMTSGRPYRPGMAQDLALDELERCAGTQFDPLVVSAFFLVLSSPGE